MSYDYDQDETYDQNISDENTEFLDEMDEKAIAEEEG